MIEAARAAVRRRGAVSATVESVFDGVPADLAMVIAEHVMRLAESGCVALAEEARLSCRSFAALASCCKSAHQMLGDSELHTEAACRRAAVLQRNHARLPSTLQFEAEEQTRQLVNTIARGVASLATHCASTHCLATRKMINRENLVCRLEVAHVCARRVALSESTAFLYCSSDEKKASRWVTAADMRGGTVWSPKSELRKIARVDVEEEVLSMRASGGLLLFSTESGLFSWRPGEPTRGLHSPVPGMVVADFWVCGGEARLLLASDDVNSELYQVDTDLDVRCVVAHMNPRPKRFTNEIEGFHSNIRPSEDGTLALAVTLTRERAKVQLLFTEEDAEELISDENARGQIVAVCLSPRGDSACVFTMGMHAVANVFLRLSADSWTLLAAVTVPSQPSAFGSTWTVPSKVATGAVFSACGSRVLFHGPRITTRPAIGSLELNGVLSLAPPRVRVKTCSIEALPREVLFSTTGVVLRTHRGVCVIRQSPTFCAALPGNTV